jgi:hypothetical protein
MLLKLPVVFGTVRALRGTCSAAFTLAARDYFRHPQISHQSFLSSTAGSSLKMKRIDLVKTGGFAAGENLITAEVPAPTELQPGYVVITVDASAVNPIDWKQAIMGILIPPDIFPIALGCDVAGFVTATAPDCAEWLGMLVSFRELASLEIARGI